LGTLQLEALIACSQPDAVAAADEQAAGLVEIRTQMADALAGIRVHVVDGAAPFVLFEVPDAHLARKQLAAKGIAVRRCDTFVGLDGQFLRAAVKPEWPTLVAALAEVLA
jgi:histidinol-phosphate aminotransferase